MRQGQEAVARTVALLGRRLQEAQDLRAGLEPPAGLADDMAALTDAHARWELLMAADVLAPGKALLDEVRSVLGAAIILVVALRGRTAGRMPAERA